MSKSPSPLLPLTPPLRAMSPSLLPSQLPPAFPHHTEHLFNKVGIFVINFIKHCHEKDIFIAGAAISTSFYLCDIDLYVCVTIYIQILKFYRDK
jgi:hypothetical protein